MQYLLGQPGEGLVNSCGRGSISCCPRLAWRWSEVNLACDWTWGTKSNSREDHEDFFKKYLEVLIRLHVWRKILLTTCFSFKQFMLIEKCPKEKLNRAVGHVIFSSDRHGTFIRTLMKCIPIKTSPRPHPHNLNMADSSHTHRIPEPDPLINVSSEVCHHLTG